MLFEGSKKRVTGSRRLNEALVKKPKTLASCRSIDLSVHGCRSRGLPLRGAAAWLAHIGSTKSVLCPTHPLLTLFLSSLSFIFLLYDMYTPGGFIIPHVHVPSRVQRCLEARTGTMSDVPHVGAQVVPE